MHLIHAIISNVNMFWFYCATFMLWVWDLHLHGIQIGLTNVVGTNSPFVTGQIAVGLYTYYVMKHRMGVRVQPQLLP